MEAAVALARAGKLERVKDSDHAELPAELSDLSIDGKVSVTGGTSGNDLIVTFYVVIPGGPDHYSAYVYRESGKLTSDPNGGGDAEITRLDDQWFWVVAH